MYSKNLEVGFYNVFRVFENIFLEILKKVILKFLLIFLIKMSCYGIKVMIIFGMIWNGILKIMIVVVFDLYILLIFFLI